MQYVSESEDEHGRYLSLVYLQSTKLPEPATSKCRKCLVLSPVFSASYSKVQSISLHQRISFFGKEFLVIRKVL